MHKIVLSIMGFAAFFLVSVTSQQQGLSGIQSVNVDIAAAIAEDNDNTIKEDSDKNDVDKKDTDKNDVDKNDTDKNDVDKNDTDKNGVDKNDDTDNDNDAVNKDHDGDDTDASCVCPPGVNACVCADGTSGDPGTPNNGVPQRNSMRSIHGDS